jgi:oligogalacturonide lyase
MAIGTISPAEGRKWIDYRTGVTIRQLTSHMSINHHPFFLIPAYDNTMMRIYFVSHRTGNPQIFAIERQSGILIQLTDLPDIAEWSVTPSRDGRYVYFTAGSGALRVDTDTYRTEELLNFGTTELREPGMVAAAMGTTAVSYDDNWWAVPVKIGSISRLVIINTKTGAHDTILERDSICHPEFHPDDSSILHYGGPYHNRVWVINRDGTGHRQPCPRNGNQWFVHEAWIPGTRELSVINWPHGMFAVNVDNGTQRQLCSFNAWHAISNRQGTAIIADTTYPDIGLQLFSTTGAESTATLCYPEAWNLGAHWQTDHCPYDDDDYKQGKWTVYAPQHTHPHPSFSPDGRHVIYTSDYTGYSQVYEVELADELI